MNVRMTVSLNVEVLRSLELVAGEVSARPSATVGAFDDAPPEPTGGAPPEAADVASDLAGAPADMEEFAPHATKTSAPKSGTVRLMHRFEPNECVGSEPQRPPACDLLSKSVRCRTRLNTAAT